LSGLGVSDRCVPFSLGTGAAIRLSIAALPCLGAID
jgi:hypothetical protein